MSKFEIQLIQKIPKLEIKISGKMDEDANLDKLKVEGFSELNVDLEKVTLINSCGVRTWVNWAKSVPENIPVVVENCPRFFVDNANMVLGFFPKNFLIQTFEVPYLCDACDAYTKIVVKNTGPGFEASIPQSLVCPKCGKDAEMDVMSSSYFKFLKV